jgi:hypothetical protein
MVEVPAPGTPSTIPERSIGYSSLAGDTVSHAALFTGGQVIDLPEFVAGSHFAFCMMRGESTMPDGLPVWA